MNAITPKGWCPSLHAPMASGDGLLVRVRPPGGVLTGEAARALAEAADRYGNGAIELTSRASLQVRGLREATLARFAAATVAAGLADPDPDVERRRTLIAPALTGDDPGMSRHTGAVVAAMEAMLATLPPLPDKFGFSVDGGGVLPVAGADIAVRLDGDACHVIADGGSRAATIPPPLAGGAGGRGNGAPSWVRPHPSPQPWSASQPKPARGGGACAAQTTNLCVAVPCRPAEAAPIAARLAQAFLALTPRCASAPRRMRALIAACGEQTFYAEANVSTAPAPPPRAPERAIGWLPYPKAVRGAFGVGLPFGATDAATLGRLAALAGQFGDGTLRATQYRAFALPGVRAERNPPPLVGGVRGRGIGAPSSERFHPSPQPPPTRGGGACPAQTTNLCLEVERLGLLADPADPRAGIAACPGRPACASASVTTRADAARLASLGLSGLHVSGCAKGCAHPAPAAVTLVGDSGRYDLVRHGRAGDAPGLRNLSLADVIAVLTTEGIPA